MRTIQFYNYPLYLVAIIAIVVVLLLSVVTGYLIQSAERNHAQVYYTESAQLAARKIEHQLSSSLAATYSLATMIKYGDGKLPEFEIVADELIRQIGGISALQLAPGGIVREIYPLAGHEKAIGHDILNDPNRRTESLTAINKH